MSTRREVILSWLREKRQTWRLCYLLGEAGSGKNLAGAATTKR